MDFTDLFTPRLDDTPNAQPGTTSDTTQGVRCLADIPARTLDWLWPGWVPAGALTILGGHVGDGKSTVTAAIVAALTTGNPLPDGAVAPRTNVLILSASDDPARVIRPRLDANHADLGRVFILDDIRGGVAGRVARRLRATIDAHNIGLVVMDPLGSVLRRSERASEGDLHEALQPLMDIIAETGVAVLGVIRVSKNGPARRPAQRLVGSSAMPAIARSVLMLARTPDDQVPNRAILQVVKGNYAEAPDPVALQLTGSCAVRWLGSADDGIDGFAESADDKRLTRSERADAADFLSEFLREKPINAVAVLKQAKALGFSEITIRCAKSDLGVESFRDACFRGFWMWRLPDHPYPPEDDQTGISN